MVKPHEKLAKSLNALTELQAEGRRVFRSAEFRRTDRERLIRNGFLREAMRGWLISTSPEARDGDSTPWFASFWEFCACYCEQRFGDQWHLSPEQSLLLHAGNRTIPRQLVVYSPKGTNNTLNLPFDTSLYDLKQKETPPKGDIVTADGLRLFGAAVALTKVPESFYRRYPVEARIALSGARASGELLRLLLTRGHSTVAGRLVGALRRIGQEDVAGEITSAMKAADYTPRESDPFEAGPRFPLISPTTSPIVSRLQAYWETHRSVVESVFPASPGLPPDRERYLSALEDIYKSDAYHSLSIEGYRVSPELVERVGSGGWNPDHHDADRSSRDALAARGYWQAFVRVREDVEAVLGGTVSGELVRRTHNDWYRELFLPCVTAGLIEAGALAGYRNGSVFLRGSRHVPPRREAVRHAMPALFDLLCSESSAGVRAVLGHWLFGFVHPYPDGNGRMARFLMNVMLASGGYPWTVIRVEDRDVYLAALEAASADGNLEPFAQFIGGCVSRSINEGSFR